MNEATTWEGLVFMSQRDAILALESAINQQVLGQDAVVRMIVVGLLADGHILLESLPGSPRPARCGHWPPTWTRA